MNILFPSTSMIGSREANAIQIDKMCAAFAAFGHRVRLLSYSNGGVRPKSRAYSLKRIAFPWRKGRYRLLQLCVFAQVLIFRPDLVFTRSAMLAALALRLGRRVILELHALPSTGAPELSALRYVARTKGLIALICISRALAEDLRTAIGADVIGDRILVAPDGADRTEFAMPKDSPSKPFRIGYFGHLYPGRGLELIQELARLTPDFQFVIYGGMEADVERWTKQFAGEPNVTLKGFVPHDQVLAFQHQCDVLLAPYQRSVRVVGGAETTRWMSPLKIFEYMAASRPIITSDLSAIREVLVNGETALLCPPDDVSAWVSAIKRLWSDPDLSRELATAAHATFLDRYTWTRRAETILAQLKTV